MARLVLLPAARADLIEIGDVIAADSPQRAVTFVAEIEARMREAAERPGSFPARDERLEGLRAARHGGLQLVLWIRRQVRGAEARQRPYLCDSLVCLDQPISRGRYGA